MTAFLRCICLGILAAGGTAGVRAATVYVFPHGDDAGPGNEAQPLRSLQAAAEKLQPGDLCLAAPGLYGGTVKPARAGAADQPIVFRSQVPGQAVLVSGKAVQGWEPHANSPKSSIWKAKVDHEPRQVFQDGVPLTWARYPNGRHLRPFEPRVLSLRRRKESVTGGGLDQPEGTWKGARLWAMDKRLEWVAQSYTVVESAVGSLTLNTDKGWWSPRKGDPAEKLPEAWCYLYGVQAALDEPGEWCCRDGFLYVCLKPDEKPAEGSFSTGTDGLAFDLAGCAHLHLEGFALRGARISFEGATDCRAEDLDARHLISEYGIAGGFNRDRGIHAGAEGLGLVLGGERNLVRRCRIRYSAGDGISIFGKNNTVENCVIRECNTSGSDCAPITCTGTGHVITRNTLCNAGRSLIVHRHLVRSKITYNHLFNAGLLCRDLGMTYTYQTDGEGTEIAYNLIHHNFAPGSGGCVGIYLDDFSRGHVVHHNVVFQVNEAIALNPPKSQRNLILNNTLSALANCISMSTSRPQDLTGTIIRNNIFRGGVMPLDKMPNVTLDTNLAQDQDPLFVAAGRGDFHLTEQSPALDAGKEMPPWTDGFVGRAPDLGAFERGAQSWKAGSDLQPPEEEDFTRVDLKGNRRRPWQEAAEGGP